MTAALAAHISSILSYAARAAMSEGAVPRVEFGAFDMRRNRYGVFHTAAVIRAANNARARIQVDGALHSVCRSWSLAIIDAALAAIHNNTDDALIADALAALRAYDVRISLADDTRDDGGDDSAPPMIQVCLYHDGSAASTAPLSTPLISNMSADGATADTSSSSSSWTLSALGHIESAYKLRYGTPRQPNLATHSRAKLSVDAAVKADCLDGLHLYSHVWLIFIFHRNTNTRVHSKVAPPRLNGARIGLFATRTPHRPNPIGLSLCRLERIDAGRYTSGSAI